LRHIQSLPPGEEKQQAFKSKLMEPISSRVIGSAAELKESLKDPLEDASTDSNWPFMLLYAVKEGVLAYFSEDRKSCEDIIYAIAASYNVQTPVGQNGQLKASRADRNGPSVKVAEYPLGRTDATTRVLFDVLEADLKRTFSVKCQDDLETNCVAFSLRLMTAFKMTIRGYEISYWCEARSDLGSKAGEAASAAWEQLYAKVGPKTGLNEQNFTAVNLNERPKLV